MKQVITIALIIFNTLICSAQSEVEKVNYFSNNAFGNPIVGYNGEYYKGVTYIAYQGEKEDPYVVAYNHEKKQWIGPYKAGTSLLGKSNSKKIDNHGKPSLVVDGQGYIHIVFGGHGGTKEFGENTLGNYNGGKQIHVVSKKPMDISSWVEVDNLTPFATYSQFLKLDNGDIYLFYRHGAHRSNWVYQVSKDNCKTFSPKVSILKAKQAKPTPDCSDVFDSWYPTFERGKGNDIIVSYNYHVCKNMTPHYSERNNCYYMTFDTDNNKWYNIKGKELKLPVTKEYADEMTLEINTADKWVQNGTVALNDLGLPHLSFYQGDADGTPHGGPKQLMNYIYTGKEWTGGATNLPSSARGEMKVTSSKDIQFLVGYNQGKSGEVAWWNSTKNLNEFAKKQVLINEEGGTFSLANFIRNAHPDAKMVATQKIKGTDYSRIFLLGDNGPVKRLKTEAEVLKLQ